MSATLHPDTIGDEAARVRLGANTETPAELLYFLARDPSVTVRAAVAMNSNTPMPADAVLANDTDDRVRAVLGRKIALAAASLGEGGESRIERVVRSLLSSLVMDEAERVRAMIADTLKELPHAPADIIQILARDTAICVSEPIIRFSPLLTEADLLALLSASPCPGTPGAIARRPGLTEAVSDALIATANTAAIRDLLANHAAAIREATLDSLIVGARHQHGWHEPLIRRPALSRSAMRALSTIVADHLLTQFLSRADLDPELQAELRARVEQKLAAAHLDTAAAHSHASALEEARAHHRAGQLNEVAITQALRAGDENLVTAMLSVAANLPLDVVDRAVSLRSAKGLVSLVWRAGFSMRTAVAVQSLLARLPPQSIIAPTASGEFSIGADEMRWQIEFLEHAAS